MKKEPQQPVASSSSLSQIVEIPSSPEQGLFEGLDQEDAPAFSSPPAKKRRSADVEERSLLVWAEIDKTPDSGRKKQMSIGSFFGSPEAARSEGEMAVVEVQQQLSRAERFQKMEQELAARSQAEGIFFVKNGSRYRFGMERQNKGGRPPVVHSN